MSQVIFKIDFTRSYLNSGTGWNRILSSNWGSTISNIVDETGTAQTGVNLVIAPGTSWQQEVDAGTQSYAASFNASACRGAHDVVDTTFIKIEGLETLGNVTSVDVEAFSSAQSASNAGLYVDGTVYDVNGGTSQTLIPLEETSPGVFANQNLTNTVTFLNESLDINDDIQLNISAPDNTFSTRGIFNWAIFTVNIDENGGGGGSTSGTSGTAPTPAPVYTTTADFQISQSSASTGDSVTITDISSTDDPSGIISYSWDFGAGAIPATSTTQGPHEISWSTIGTKIITLQVSTDFTTETITKSIQITGTGESLVYTGPTYKNIDYGDFKVKEINTTFTQPNTFLADSYAWTLYKQEWNNNLTIKATSTDANPNWNINELGHYSVHVEYTINSEIITIFHENCLEIWPDMSSATTHNNSSISNTSFGVSNVIEIPANGPGYLSIQGVQGTAANPKVIKFANGYIGERFLMNNCEHVYLYGKKSDGTNTILNCNANGQTPAKIDGYADFIWMYGFDLKNGNSSFKMQDDYGNIKLLYDDEITRDAANPLHFSIKDVNTNNDPGLGGNEGFYFGFFDGYRISRNASDGKYPPNRLLKISDCFSTETPRDSYQFSATHEDSVILRLTGEKYGLDVNQPAHQHMFSINRNFGGRIGMCKSLSPGDEIGQFQNMKPFLFYNNEATQMTNQSTTGAFAAVGPDSAAWPATAYAEQNANAWIVNNTIFQQQRLMRVFGGNANKTINVHNNVLIQSDPNAVYDNLDRVTQTNNAIYTKTTQPSYFKYRDFANLDLTPNSDSPLLLENAYYWYDDVPASIKPPFLTDFNGVVIESSSNMYMGSRTFASGNLASTSGLGSSTSGTAQPDPEPDPDPGTFPDFEIVSTIVSDDFTSDNIALWDSDQESGAGTKTVSAGVKSITSTLGWTEWLKTPLSGDYMVEYEIRDTGANTFITDNNAYGHTSVGASGFTNPWDTGGEGSEANDMKLYQLVHGANNNTVTRMRRYRGDGSGIRDIISDEYTTSEYLLTQNQWYRIRFIKIENWVSYRIDNLVVANYNDPNPHLDPGFYGIRLRNPDMEIRNFKVYEVQELVSTSGIAVPDAPSNLSVANSTSSSITISWTSIYDEHEVEFKTQNETTWQTIIPTNGAKSIQISNLFEDTVYEIRVQSILNGIYSEYSEILNAQTQRETIVEVCAAATQLSATLIDATTVSFDWNVGNNVTKSLLYFKESTDTTWQIKETINSNLTISLKPSTIYDYRVATVCSTTLGSFSSTQTISTQAVDVAECTVSTLTQQITNNIVLFDWSVSNNVTKSYLYIKKASASTYTQAYVVQNASQFQLTLEENTQYNWKVVPECSGTIGNEVVGANFTTGAAPTNTSAATNLTVLLFGNIVRFEWDIPSSTTSTYVYFRKVGATNWQIRQTVTTTIDVEIEYSSIYEWKVQIVENGVLGNETAGTNFTSGAAPSSPDLPASTSGNVKVELISLSEVRRHLRLHPNETEDGELQDILDTAIAKCADSLLIPSYFDELNSESLPKPVKRAVLLTCADLHDVMRSGHMHQSYKPTDAIDSLLRPYKKIDMF